MPENLELRLHGPASLPTLVYLPGLHGDWTLVGSFRRRMAGRVRFVEMNYPRTVAWSLDQYGAAVESALAEHGITGGWLLGESFGSQVLWAIVARKRFQLEGIILAGGFVQHPMRWGVELVEWLAGGVSATWLKRIVFAYARLARFRYRHSPEVVADLDEFTARRSGGLDLQAVRHRLRLIARNNPRSVARENQAPVYAVTGLLDPIVPWPCVRRWLKRNCPSLRDYRILPGADHHVLGTASAASAETVARWMSAPPPPRTQRDAEPR